MDVAERIPGFPEGQTPAPIPRRGKAAPQRRSIWNVPSGVYAVRGTDDWILVRLVENGTGHNGWLLNADRKVTGIIPARQIAEIVGRVKRLGIPEALAAAAQFPACVDPHFEVR